MLRIDIQGCLEVFYCLLEPDSKNLDTAWTDGNIESVGSAEVM